VHRRTCLLTLLAAGCDRPARAIARPPPATTPTRAPYGALRARIAELQTEHRERYVAAGDDAAKRAVRDEARKQLQGALVDVILPAWLGTRWAFHGTADEPLEPQGIACGYFVATVLQHVGLHLESRRRFGQSTALTIARSLVPPGPSHHRVFSVPAKTLEDKVRSFGDGLYLIGLDVHVGFVVVAGGAVRVVHASYLGTRTVVDEPIAACEAIERSRDAGYHVTSLFAGDTLVDAWLTRWTIPLRTA
jgi:hypothetical protein